LLAQEARRVLLPGRHHGPRALAQRGTPGRERRAGRAGPRPAPAEGRRRAGTPGQGRRLAGAAAAGVTRMRTRRFAVTLALCATVAQAQTPGWPQWGGPTRDFQGTRARPRATR